MCRLRPWRKRAVYELLRHWTLKLLRVPAEPHPPVGDPASLRVFNAGRNYFRLRMARWGLTQLLALAGFIFWTALLMNIERTAREQKEARANRGQAAAPVSAGKDQTDRAGAQRSKTATKRRQEKWLDRAAVERIRDAAAPREEAGADGKAGGKGKRLHGWAGFKQGCVELALLLPSGAFLLIWGIKIVSFLVYAAQIPLTYAVRRLDYEMRWYMVTDRSLRLRSGVWRVSEATMSFANIQQVLVSQGPLQRLLGLADVKVKSAGGGSGGHHDHEGSDMHTGLFQSVTNASEIRDLILERLRRFREAGLGDADDKSDVSPDNIGRSSETLSAAREVAAEARALRALLTRPLLDR